MSAGQVRTNAAEVLKDTCLLESAERERRIGFRRYEEYRDSGVEWIGEVPAGWTIKKLKFVVAIQPSNVDKKTKENEKEVLLCNYTDVYYNEEITGDLSFMKATASDLQIRKFTLKSGDTIITKDSEDPNDIAVPAYVPQDLEGIICGYHLALLRPKYGILGGYLKRVMDSRYARSVFAAKANGLTRYGLGTYPINNFALPLPPIEEQRQITAYLDRETAKIDSLVTRQEQLIELLREKRQAIISHAVTEGLNIDVNMRDSGVEWLGKVPVKWKIKSLKFTATINDDTLLEDTDTDFEFDYVDIGSVDYVAGISSKETTTFENAPARARRIVKSGDTIVSTVRTYLRAIAYVREFDKPLIVSTGFAVVRPKAVYADFLAYALKASFFVQSVVARSVGVSYPAINASEIGNIFVPLPNEKEQTAIAAFLDRETVKIDDLIERCETAIELLKERRIALISAAVTGKIDVRSAV